MIILISPTKTMYEHSEQSPKSLPLFIKEASEIHQELIKFDSEQLQTLMHINEKIAHQNVQRYQTMRFDEHGFCAIDLYDGLQFKYMDKESFDETQKNYLQQHLRILSGLYGILKPYDSIYPYRLEMQCKLPVAGKKDLYAYWKLPLAQCIQEELAKQQDARIINLSSNEYSKALASEIDAKHWIQVIFQVEKQGKRKVEATAAKMARGRMVNYIATKGILHAEDLKEFAWDGYQFDMELSTEQSYVFYKVIKKEEE